jgi:hypothetical protein
VIPTVGGVIRIIVDLSRIDRTLSCGRPEKRLQQSVSLRNAGVAGADRQPSAAEVDGTLSDTLEVFLAGGVARVVGRQHLLADRGRPEVGEMPAASFQQCRADPVPLVVGMDADVQVADAGRGRQPATRVPDHGLVDRRDGQSHLVEGDHLSEHVLDAPPETIASIRSPSRQPP